MNKEEKVFEMVKAIAPAFVSKGVELQERIVAAGSNPENCTVGGMSILDAQAHSAKEWAEAFVNALESEPEEYNTKGDIMDTHNAHNAELVRKINAAWKSNKYHNKFSEILIALSSRDHTEFEEKFGCSVESDGTWAMAHAHEIMYEVCDDQDLETILSFIRYEE